MHSDHSLQRRAEEQLKHSLRLREISRRKSVFQDARLALLHARPYRLWMMLLGYMRRFRMISFILQVITWLLTALQTGALVLLTTAVFFVILPLFALLLIGVLLTALLDLHRSRKNLLAAIENKRVYLIFSAEGTFGIGNARALADQADCAVLAVSPFWLSPRGLGSRRFYVNVRRDGESLFLIRRYFFLAVRKNILTNAEVMLY